MTGQVAALAVIGAALAMIALLEGRGARILAFPFLLCASWLAFLVAPLAELARSGDDLWHAYLAVGAVDAALLAILLSAAAGLAGYALSARAVPVAPPPEAPPPPALVRALDLNACLLGALSFAAFGVLIHLGGGAERFLLRSGHYAMTWEGAPVHALFAARFVYLAIAIQLWLWARTGARRHLVLALAFSCIPLVNILFLLRRSEIVVLGLLWAYVPITYRGLRVPRAALIGAGLMLALAMRLLPLLRSEAGKARPWGDLLAEATAPRTGFANTEIGSMLYGVHAALEADAPGRGGLFWNALVKQFVPSGLVGDLKSALLLPDPGAFEGGLTAFHAYLSPVAVAQGMQQFHHAGALIFLGVGAWAAWMERRRHAAPRIEILWMVMLPFLVAGITADLSVLLTRLVTYGVLVALLVPRAGSAQGGRPATRPASIASHLSASRPGA